MPKQRLILLFDGTWNDPQDQTNVYRIARHINDHDESVRQRFYYEPGVGTSPMERIRGGVSGYGLSRNLLQGYEWLARRYTENDELWIFGFSRGAYTARSLVGLLRKCGLLHIVTPGLLEKAESIYRNKRLAPDCDTCTAFRQTYSREPRIHFIGVWDTVGALGVPGSTMLSEKGRYSWHDTELSSIVDHAFHAMALDEHRAAYDTALWTTKDGLPKPKNRTVEQRWFIGAHANVGGGYGSNDPLADLPLAWIMQKAAEVGLRVDGFGASDDAWQAEPTDSYRAFLKGAYALFRGIRTFGKGRHHRAFATGLNGQPAVQVTVDASVWQRWNHAPLSYRPQTLVRAGVHPP